MGETFPLKSKAKSKNASGNANNKANNTRNVNNRKSAKDSSIVDKIREEQKRIFSKKAEDDFKSLFKGVKETVDAKAKEASTPKYKRNVKAEHKFWVSDGRELNNLLELAHTIRHMKDETFSNHVNDNKNDFANWIKDCMVEEQLANDLSKYKTKFSNELLILRHITDQLKENKENDAIRE